MTYPAGTVLIDRDLDRYLCGRDADRDVSGDDVAAEYLERFGAHPAFVIDPEDDVQLDRIGRYLLDGFAAYDPETNRDAVRKALTWAAAPVVIEPIVAGATVADTDGRVWVRVGGRWVLDSDPSVVSSWDDLMVVEVLSRGAFGDDLP